MYSNCCCSCSLEPEIIEIVQSSHTMYSNNILNFQESTPILNVCTKKSGNLWNSPRISLFDHCEQFIGCEKSQNFAAIRCSDSNVFTTKTL